ncbi:MAG: ATP-binding protein [Chloroflexi bacterium]|nr:ATP-binding protein [Chloroflexota bacterium]
MVRLPRSLHWRIALAYTALIFVTMGVVSVYLVSFVRESYITNLQASLHTQARLVSDRVSDETPTAVPIGFIRQVEAELQASVSSFGQIADARVTVIKADGNVIADSLQSPAQLPSPLGRDEVRATLSQGSAGSVGVGPSLDDNFDNEMLYAIAPIARGDEVVGAVRVAVPLSQVQPDISRLIASIVVAAVLVELLSVGAGYFIFRRTSRSVRAVADGATRFAQGDLGHRVSPISSDETQELAAAFNSMADTIRRMLNDMSAESSKLTAMLNTMEDGVVVIEADGRITLMNSAAEWLLGVSARDAVGARLVEALRDHEIQQVATLSLTSGQLRQAEVELLHHRRFLNAIATPLGGDSNSILLTLHDLTANRQVENTLREFVTNVSHELRSPLASVKIMVETLEDGALENRPTARDYLQRINRELDRMNAIVEDLLELSRLESGQQLPSLMPLDLSALVNEVVWEYRGRTADGVSLRVDAPGYPAFALGDGGKLRQAMVNLLDNALKNTAAGSVTVFIESDEDKHAVHVRDTGSGIAREHLPHVFERFYKVDRARRDGGSGLGLAIVQQIVQAHGGEVSVQSEEGIGSTFRFTVARAWLED